MTDSPAITQPDLEYQQFLQQGKFMIQRSRGSGNYVFFPRVAEPGTGALDLEWVPASGKGEVYSVTVISPKPPAAPYNVALVTLDEGPRMMTRVEGLPAADVKIGMRVQARIHVDDNSRYIVFDPAA